MSQSLTPIVVDLDDTLAKTDFFYESLLKFIKLNIFNFFRAIYWLVSKDKAYLKSQIAKVVEIDPSLIPYNSEVIEWVKSKKKMGHKIILATATHRTFADAVANYLNIFDYVYATDENQNLKGDNKEKKLIELYGKRGFIYVGDSRADLKVWRSAKAAVVVSSSKNLLQEVQSITQIEKIISTDRNQFPLPKLFHLELWLKSLPVFLALILFGNITSPRDWIAILIAFISLSLSVFAVSIFDDLFSLESSRLNANGRVNPFASGKLSITKGVSIALCCLLVSFSLGILLSLKFTILIILYFLMMFGHLVYLKLITPKPVMILLYSLMQLLAGYLVITIN